jgi:hypothetical protein
VKAGFREICYWEFDSGDSVGWSVFFPLEVAESQTTQFS